METKIFYNESLESGLNELEVLLSDMQNKHHLEDEIYGNMLICLSEAYTNAFKHGNNNEIKLTFSQEDDSFEFSVEDGGNGFNFNELPDPTDPLNIEKETGRGLFIIKSLADDIHFNDKGNCIFLKFNLQKHVV
jgi:serine/threonine-protein kinase RsbW